MTAKGLYEAVLIEMAKLNAPNILLEDFNYFANKTVQQYINKRYNIYDVSQLTTDDLRVLKATAILPVHKTSYRDKLGLDNLTSMFMDATYTAELPSDYYHLLNCLCLFKVNNTNKCYNKDSVARFSATRLTADTWSQVVDNYWLRPSYKRPYYYIHNVNTDTEVPTNPVLDYEYIAEGSIKSIKNIGTDKKLENGDIFHELISYDYTTPEPGPVGTYYVKKEIGTNSETLWFASPISGHGQTLWVDVSNQSTGQNFSYNGIYYMWNGSKLEEISNITEASVKTKTEQQYQIVEQGQDPFKKIDLNGFISTSNGEYPQRSTLVRYGNASKPLIEIRYGEDTTTFELYKIMVDYIKAPQHIRLTQEQIDRTLDYSQVLEFPDYVCQEIVNELVHNIMENIADPRLQTHPVVSLSIANPAQQLTSQE